METFNMIAEVGAPVAAAIASAVFLFIIIRKLMDDIIDDIATLQMCTKGLTTRVRTMNNDMIKLDTTVSAAVGLKPDLERLARAENFIEDGEIDARRD